MRFAICDDEVDSIAAIVNYFQNREDINCEITEFTDGNILAKSYQKDRFDVLFLDLEMPEISGIEIAEAIRKVDDWIIIVFVTSHSQYMKECFKCLPLGFVEKDRLEEDLDHVMKDVLTRLKQKRQTYCFKDNKEYVKLYCDEIIYFEKINHYVEIHTKTECFRQRITLADLEKVVPKYQLFRISRGFLVNLDYIKKIEGYKLVLRYCENKLPIGRERKESLRQAIFSRKKEELDALWLQ